MNSIENNHSLLSQLDSVKNDYSLCFWKLSINHWIFAARTHEGYGSDELFFAADVLYDVFALIRRLRLNIFLNLWKIESVLSFYQKSLGTRLLNNSQNVEIQIMHCRIALSLEVKCSVCKSADASLSPASDKFVFFRCSGISTLPIIWVMEDIDNILGTCGHLSILSESKPMIISTSFRVSNF